MTGSRRHTLSSANMTTQMEPKPIAGPPGKLPTGMRVACPLLASMRSMSLVSEPSALHAAPYPNAMPRPKSSNRSRYVSSRRSGCRRQRSTTPGSPLVTIQESHRRLRGTWTRHIAAERYAVARTLSSTSITGNSTSASVTCWRPTLATHNHLSPCPARPSLASYCPGVCDGPGAAIDPRERPIGLAGHEHVVADDLDLARRPADRGDVHDLVGLGIDLDQRFSHHGGGAAGARKQRSSH